MSLRRTGVSWITSALILTGIAVASAASAQTIVLNQPGTQVWDTTLRGGTYASTNYDTQPLVTKANSNASLVRRAILKFDTQNTIAAGATVTKAVLTLTVGSTNGTDASRPIATYQVLESFDSGQATWNVRKTSYSWTSLGGDLGIQLAQASVSNVAGTKVSFDVTKLVQMAVSGSLGTRYTRIALVDAGTVSDQSYRSYEASESTDATARPVLTVTLGTTTTTPPTGLPTTSSAIRVLQWNTHHGGWRTDGVWDPKLLMSWVATINPDIVSLNEVERNDSWSQGQDDLSLYLSLLKQITGQTWYGVFVVGSGASSGIGNAILSKTPFVSTSHYQLSYGRAVLHASITWNGQTFNFFSTHLDANSSSYRLTEISELKSWAGTFAQQRVIAGDLNAGPGSSEWNSMSQSYVDAWAAAVKLGTAIAFPDDPNGNTRNSRIDYIWASQGATNLVLRSAQVFDTRDANGVMPSDHRPLLAIYDVK